MSKNSKIEWTDHTFNPWIGCQKVSPGCQQTKVVLVPSGDPVMLAKPTKAKVYAFDKDQKLVGPSTVTPPDPRSSPVAPISGLPETLTPAELRELPAALF